ncbi:MAG: DUF6048 family protein [Paludibacter sp.]|nr:DUF6048 family protein [Paludibacter sp.]MDD4199504.1 DUF6048 family protein [Paludibacter sp.]MDD4428714.1 DUF6048 family protein [Paludibacter sp.]
MYSIYRYFFSVLLACCVTTILTGQEVKKEKNDSTKSFVLNSVRVEVDVSPVLTTFLNRGDIFHYEAALQAEINKRFYPVFEMGYAGGNKLTNSGISYSGDALFYRLGMDFNIIKNKTDNNSINNFFLVGARLGYTHFKYDMLNVSFEDDYWGTSIQKDIQNKSSNLWFEITAGIRVEISKNLYIGWTARIKNMLTQTEVGAYKPWYVAGFGINEDESVWGFNYLIGYKF